MTAVDATMSEIELDDVMRAYHDVTERLQQAYVGLTGEVGRLRQELTHKNRELARRERLAALGQLAAGLAHEVRNPLGGMMLYASMLERDLADRPRELELTRRISRGARSLERLVSEILEFSQDCAVEPRDVRFGDLLSAVRDGATPWLCRDDFELDVGAITAATVIHCDPERMQRALLNLVINAYQAMEFGGAVTIEAHEDNGATRLVVRDTGPGVADERIERIFDPFYTTRSDGTGLGLAIVHQIVEAHRGSIRAVNQPEGGLRFEIMLPGSAEAAGGSPHARVIGLFPPAGPAPWIKEQENDGSVPNRLAS